MVCLVGDAQLVFQFDVVVHHPEEVTGYAAVDPLWMSVVLQVVVVCEDFNWVRALH